MLEARLQALDQPGEAYLSADALWQIAGSVMNKDKIALYDLLLVRARRRWVAAGWHPLLGMK